MVNLFTYGSLMCNDIMFAVTGYRVESGKAILNNFYRSGLHNEEYPGITPDSGSHVDGVLYLNLPETVIERLDVFEGEYYFRRNVQVYSEEFGDIAAMTYVIKPQFSHLLTYTEWSYSQFLEVGKKKFEKKYFGFRDLMDL